MHSKRKLVERSKLVVSALLESEGKPLPEATKKEAQDVLLDLENELLKDDTDVNLGVVIKAAWRISEILNKLGLTDDLIEMIRNLW